MSRLLTLLLLYRAGFIVGKYISITTIERTLADLVASGFIDKIGVGRSTTYVKK